MAKNENQKCQQLFLTVPHPPGPTVNPLRLPLLGHFSSHIYSFSTPPHTQPHKRIIQTYCTLQSGSIYKTLYPSTPISILSSAREYVRIKRKCLFPQFKVCANGVSFTIYVLKVSIKIWLKEQKCRKWYYYTENREPWTVDEPYVFFWVPTRS